MGTVGREESYFEKETSQEGVPMQVRKLVDCVDGSPSTLVFCGCELQEEDGCLSIFS